MSRQLCDQFISLSHHCRNHEGRLSIILDEVNDGLWGANGAIWYLADFTQAAGYRHLQGLTGK